MEKLNFRNLWIFSGVSMTLCYLILAICLYFDFLIAPFYIIAVLMGWICVILTTILCIKDKINTIWEIIISVLSFIMTVITPFAAFLPLIIATAKKSDKKAHILKWILGIVLTVLSALLVVPFLLVSVMATDSGVPQGWLFFLWIFMIFLGFNFPFVTLYGVILGNKKSYWYYLLLSPIFMCVVAYIYLLVK